MTRTGSITAQKAVGAVIVVVFVAVFLWFAATAIDGLVAFALHGEPPSIDLAAAGEWILKSGGG